jgi:hypothetical protein
MELYFIAEEIEVWTILNVCEIEESLFCFKVKTIEEIVVVMKMRIG